MERSSWLRSLFTAAFTAAKIGPTFAGVMETAPLTVQQAYRQLVALLAPAWGQGEARATARALFEDAFDQQRPAESEALFSAEQALRLEEFTRRLLERDEPLAYLTGVSHFAGMKLAVNANVLIPRPETEEWVYRVIQDWQAIAGPQRFGTPAGKTIRVLEVGTGSGCIALAVARALPGFSVTALDLSSDALALAAHNASHLGIAVNFLQGNFLDPAFRASLPDFDLLLSNPPYIDPREMPELDRRVSNFEPHLALFGPAQDPLAFYGALADFAQTHLPSKNTGETAPAPSTTSVPQPEHASLGLPVAYLETSALTASAALLRWQAAGLKGRVEKDLSGRDRLLLGWQ